MTYELGVMVYVCRLSYSRGWDRGTSGAREIADSLGNIPRSRSHNKKAPNHTSTSPGQKEVEDGYQIGMSVDCGVRRTMTKTSQINYLQEKFEVDYLSVCLSIYLFIWEGSHEDQTNLECANTAGSGFENPILLLAPLECWDFRSVPPGSADWTCSMIRSPRRPKEAIIGIFV